ncbi:MAG: tRNA (adenosine(37)-N6)-dimethylallyltransferase MiaA [Syntrophobacteraceae bacterium]|jgi:tRNA dimethylallyltransferase
MSRFSDSSKEAEPGRDIPLVLLAGPTACGKTSLSLELAALISAEIVNADSMQVYRRMEIGTAKPAPEQRRIVPHHLIDVADPDEPFDAARYLQLARPVVEDIRKRGLVPLVVGGTGLYMRVLTRGICPGPPSDPELKKKLIADEKSKGLAQLYGDLLRIDPESAARIHPNDRQRILRAIEVFELTGVALSVLQKGHGFKEKLFPSVKVFINREREALFERINRRVDLMIESGLKDEVEKLLGMGYSTNLKSMQSLGYKQMSAHISGALSLDEAVRLIKRETRRYAKRQITWFRGDHEFRPFDADDIDGIFDYVMQEISGPRN